MNTKNSSVIQIFCLRRTVEILWAFTRCTHPSL